jgi:hypothetical protein
MDDCNKLQHKAENLLKMIVKNREYSFDGGF